MRNVHVLGVGQAAPLRQSTLRLEEMAYIAATEALRDAGVSRSELDHVTLAASDELDGRPISSMLMSAPAGGYLTDEIKVSDSGAMALTLGYARVASGDFDIGLVVSWCKSSKTDINAIDRMGAEPFYTRPLGLDGRIADAMLAQAVMEHHGVSTDDTARQVVSALTRAHANPRGMRHAIPGADDIASGGYEATPLRRTHMAPHTDGAVAMVLASDRYLDKNRHLQSLCRVAGVGWNTDGYSLGAARLSQMASAGRALEQAMHAAGIESAAELDLIELDTPTIFHQIAYEKALGLQEDQISPAGGSFAQNPLFCMGMVNAMEAVLQVSGRAGPVQRSRARRAAAHGCHGFAQQGNVFVIFEGESS